MFAEAGTIGSDAVIEYDICIMGAGAAGITIAHELRNTPLRVCVLEGGGLDYEDESQNLYRGHNLGDRYPDTSENRLRFFGGSTNHWGGACLPLDEIDFEVRDWVKYSGWPFDRKHMDPYYERAQPYCELAEYNYDPAYWARKSGLEMFPIKQDVVLMAGSQSSPPTNFGEVYRVALKKSRNVTVILNANVVEIETNDQGGQVDAALVQVIRGGRFRVKARQFVLAMGGIENARLLLVSNKVHKAGLGNQNDLVGRFFMDHPVAKAAIYTPSRPPSELRRYLGPATARDGHVGAHVALRPETLRKEQLTNARAPFVEVTRLYASEGVESFHSLVQSIEQGDVPEEFWRHVGNVAADIDMIAEGVSRSLFDYPLFESANDRGFYVFDSMMEQTPEPDNRITLASDRDALGMPKVNVDWRVSARDRESFWRVHEIIAREIGRAGLGRVRLLRDQGERIWGELLNYGSHHMGTTRAHANPRQGVVDGNMRIHDVSNLHIAGSSVFPTGGHHQPTLTIVALATRLADRLREITVGKS